MKSGDNTHYNGEGKNELQANWKEIVAILESRWIMPIAE
jgi:hypothetical protein